jgi:hypothetical protein
MSRWDADSDYDYTNSGVRFSRPCEGRGCDNEVSLSSTSVFCPVCLAEAEARVITQRNRELHERKAS